MHPWVLVHAAATWAMVGFIWTIQLLVYPLMANVPADGFPAFEAVHQRRVVMVLALFAVIEVIAAIAIAVSGSGVPTALWLVGGILLVGLWVATGAFFAPLHGRLADGFDPALHSLLLTTNWFRTIGWTCRGAIAIWMLVSVSD